MILIYIFIYTCSVKHFRYGSNVSCLILSVLGVGKGVYQRDYRAQKKVDQGAFNSSIWELEDTLHGIEGMKGLNCVYVDPKNTLYVQWVMV
jgi:hypothetical protein